MNSHLLGATTGDLPSCRVVAIQSVQCTPINIDEPKSPSSAADGRNLHCEKGRFLLEENDITFLSLLAGRDGGDSTYYLQWQTVRRGLMLWCQGIGSKVANTIQHVGHACKRRIAVCNEGGSNASSGLGMGRNETIDDAGRNNRCCSIYAENYALSSCKY